MALQVNVSAEPQTTDGLGEPGPGRPPAAPDSARLVAKPAMVCPSCAKRLRWPHSYPGKATCPSCCAKLVILVDQFEKTCSARLRNGSAECDLAANWLDYDRLGRDDEVARHIESLPDDWLDSVMGDSGR